MDMFEQVRADERLRVAAFLRRKGKEAQELLLKRATGAADWAVAELAGKTVERLFDVVADMVRLGVMP